MVLLGWAFQSLGFLENNHTSRTGDNCIIFHIINMQRNSHHFQSHTVLQTGFFFFAFMASKLTVTLSESPYLHKFPNHLNFHLAHKESWLKWVFNNMPSIPMERTSVQKILHLKQAHTGAHPCTINILHSTLFPASGSS